MGEMKDRMLAGQEYKANDPDLRADGRRAAELTARYNAEPEHDRRRELLTELFGSVGVNTTIRPELRCDYGYNVTVGANVFVNWGAVFLDVGRITVGDFVQIGPNCQFLTATHPLDVGRRREGWEGSAPITLADDVWLGGGVIVLPGVTIGAGTVVGAGAVVTKDLPAGVLAVGNPARVVRQLG
ncbi:sugar O-acetyltransferase [Modestobacter excelsi]|uniref:sugar O-acetyltransferase n=1 Tax=Modestobacter excelsi TaxID=2213161 RepID=UPI00110CABC6|nr:sugar O-acetyltransferase [Modestobacter excelsi]